MRKLEKIAMVGLPILIIVFLIIWASKSKQPIVNDITTGYSVEQSSSNIWWQGEEETSAIKDNSIPDGYVKVPGEDNLYMVLDENDKVKEYVLRTIAEDGSSNWELFNKNISSIMTHVEGDIYKRETKDKTLYFKYIEKDDGSYTIEYIKDYEENTENTIKEEVIRESRYEDGFIVVYETVIIKTYNSAGELINTRTEGPNVVSKSKDEDTMDVKREWISGEYAKKSGKCDYKENISDVLMGLLNTKRKELGATAYTSDAQSVETIIAKTAAAELLSNDFNYNSEFFSKLDKYYPNYNILSLTVPHSVGNTNEEIAEFVHKQFDGNEDACKIRYGTKYTNAAICVVNADEGYFIVEIYNIEE